MLDEVPKFGALGTTLEEDSVMRKSQQSFNDVKQQKPDDSLIELKPADDKLTPKGNVPQQYNTASNNPLVGVLGKMTPQKKSDVASPKAQEKEGTPVSKTSGGAKKLGMLIENKLSVNLMSNLLNPQPSASFKTKRNHSRALSRADRG